nr:hypothetical protein [Tanacetum cinerariifolium]
MPPKKTSTSATPVMTQAAIRQLVADSIAAALEAQDANMANTNNINRNTRTSRTPLARKGTNEITNKSLLIEETLLPTTTTTTPTSATIITTEITTTITTVTKITTNSRTEGKTKSTMETFLCVQDAPCITQEFALSSVVLVIRWVIGPGTAEAKDQPREATCV